MTFSKIDSSLDFPTGDSASSQGAWAISEPGAFESLCGRRDIVAIGAAMGGLTAICKLLSRLPSGFDAAILIALDIGAQPATVVLQILRSYSRLPVDYATQGLLVRRGRVFFAPPAHDLRVVPPGILAVDDMNAFTHGGPSVNSLFKSVAHVYGRRVIGIVLSGATHDGTSGLTVIESGGGVGIVQDPDEAADAAMPANALRRDHPDYCSLLDGMAPLIISLVAGEQPSSVPVMSKPHG